MASASAQVAAEGAVESLEPLSASEGAAADVGAVFAVVVAATVDALPATVEVELVDDKPLGGDPPLAEPLEGNPGADTALALVLPATGPGSP